MRAVKFDSYGGPEVLYVTDVERPQPSSGQMLVRVKATSINPIDYKVRRGDMQGMVPVTFPSGQGGDFAGVVEALADDVLGFGVGDEVFGSTATRDAQAQYAVVEAARVARKPVGLTWETAGSISIVGTTAWAMVASVNVSAEDTVLISGASGGVGSLACQLAVAAGATVIGVASERNHAWLKSLGVTPVTYGDGLDKRIIDAAADAAAQRVAEGGSADAQIDAVLDAQGDGYVDLGLKLGVAPERIDTVADHATAAQRPGVKTEGSAFAPVPQSLVELADQILERKLELRIDRVFPMDQVRAAYELLEGGHPHGKIVLTP